MGSESSKDVRRRLEEQALRVFGDPLAMHIFQYYEKAGVTDINDITEKITQLEVLWKYMASVQEQGDAERVYNLDLATGEIVLNEGDDNSVNVHCEVYVSVTDAKIYYRETDRQGNQYTREIPGKEFAEFLTTDIAK